MATPTLGEGRRIHGEFHMQDLEEIVSKYSYRKEIYYILCVIKPHPLMPNVLIHKYQILNRKPPLALLSTILYRVDNSKGLVEMEWCLPQDVPINDDLVTTDGSEAVWASGKMVAPAIQYG